MAGVGLSPDHSPGLLVQLLHLNPHASHTIINARQRPEEKSKDIKLDYFIEEFAKNCMNKKGENLETRLDGSVKVHIVPLLSCKLFSHVKAVVSCTEDTACGN